MVYGCSSLVESIVWLIPFLCVQRKKKNKMKNMKRREDISMAPIYTYTIYIYPYINMNICIRICGSRHGVST